MTASWTTSAVLIAPAARRDAANALAEAMGWGPGCFSVPLSATGADPATHYGLHTWADDAFAGLLEGAAAGDLPEGLAGAFEPGTVAALLGSLIISIEAAETDPGAHYGRVLDGAGLRGVVGEEA